jgi:class 3 adenylate cyclase
VIATKEARAAAGDALRWADADVYELRGIAEPVHALRATAR